MSETNNDSNSLNRENDITLELQLGDVIQIFNPVNENLNEQIFIIDYIDSSKARLINSDTLENINLKISEDSLIGDGNITKIAILSRSDTPSYARQNDLLPGKWINIYFGGDYPTILTGEITNLEEDMIEIKTVENDIIYINFDYKGIPEDLPIENIEIREKPQSPIKKPLEGEELEQGEGLEDKGFEEGEVEEKKDFKEGEIKFPELEVERKVLGKDKIQFEAPLINIKNQLREFIIKADQISFGTEYLGPVTQFIDVSKKSQRYSIEVQVADLLDELLSTIPNSQRTPRVLNNIHIMIERFKQLREHFSFFDDYGNVEGALIVEANYKPLGDYFKDFKQNLYWVLPVVKNIKKIYDANTVDDENTDVVNISLNSDLTNIKDIIERYKSNTLPVDQNKYSTFYSELNPSFTPFDLIGDENMEGVLIEKEVNQDINVIIDNLEDLYSSIFTNNNIRTKRFVIDRYNLGLTKLDTTDSTSSRLYTRRVKISNSDTMTITSFLTLPEPTIRFSKINLPGTDILSRANLNSVFLNYWEFLKKKTSVNPIFIDTLTNEIEFNENNFANNIKQYVLNLSADELKGTSKTDIYKMFYKLIIPKTKILFNLMKKYITGKLSIVEVVSYLEPFLVYTDFLTYMQYVEIVKFIDSQISEYNKNFIERSRVFAAFSRIKSADIVATNAFSIINNINDKLREDIFSDYDIEIQRNMSSTYTNGEILRKLTIKDYNRLYTTGLSLQNISLMFPNDISSIFEDERNALDKKRKNDINEKCKTITVSKFYSSLESLNADNGKTIYFDKKYDTTNYGVLEDRDGYEKQVLTMSPEDLNAYIVTDLIRKKNMTEFEASYLADTLIDGHKKVIDGQHAILYKGYNQETEKEIEYYVRKDNKWELDTDMSTTVNTDENDILCNLQEKCISVPNDYGDKCESVETNENILQTRLLKSVINEFDTRYNVSKRDFEKEMKDKYEYYSSIIGSLSNIEMNKMLKYNNQKYKLGANIEDDIAGVSLSPSSKLLNMILSQTDFVKKQYDIVRFVTSYTRPAVINMDFTSSEDQYWLYCPKTNVKLLPIFKYNLAAEYVKNPSGYKDYLDLLKSQIGKLSDDGDWWCDKNTSWSICPVDFDVEEGYEAGFKISTRSALEENAGNNIMSSTNVNNTQNVIKYNTPENRMINNIVNTLCVAMGINIEPQKEFIINCVLTALRDTLETEEDYKDFARKKAQEGKKVSSYRDVYNSAILYYTFGMFLIAIQTSIPSIKTRKTHPGCVRSFAGFPFEGTGDLSSLTYLSCVAYDIRESGEPWNVLKGKKAEIVTNKIKGSIDVLLGNADVNRKFEEKTEYLLTTPASDIPKEHDITKWTQFLPPLVPFKIKRLTNISSDFSRSLISDLRIGSPNQREKLLVIDSKIILFSLAIQEAIQEVVKKSHLILQNSNHEPYIENACCDSSEKETTIGYFINHKPIIKEFNVIVEKLSNILKDVSSYSTAGLFYSNINTKNKYPPISDKFDEQIIYLAFIHFCKFKSLMPIPDELLPLCIDKPDSALINQNDSVDRIIQKLKEDGRNYKGEQLLRLLQLIGRRNTVNITFDTQQVSYITKITSLLESIEEQNDENIEGSFVTLLTRVLDTFDIATSGPNKEVRNLNNYLIKSIDTIKEDIIDFIEKNCGSGVTKSSIRKATTSIVNLSSWVCEGSNRNKNIKISDDETYNIIGFYKTFTENFVDVFPNIILNKVNHSDTQIPKYYGFSDNHSKKLKRYINEYYEGLNSFYGIPIITNILGAIQRSCRNIVLLSQTTPCFTSIKGDKEDTDITPIFEERTSKYLYEFYLLKVLFNYIELADNNDMLAVGESRKETEVTDIFTVDYIEERNTRVDITMNTRDETQRQLVAGNLKDLRQKVAQLLIAFIEIMSNQKDAIDISYEDIQDRVFKLREKEKDLVTDRLKQMTDEQRDADTILKINKLGMYSKGMQKGLTILDKNFYDEEQDFRNQMDKAERNIRKKNKDANDENIDILLDDYMEQQQVENDIENEAYDMSYMNEDFYNGNTDGNGAPEEEYDDYEDFE